MNSVLWPRLPGLVIAAYAAILTVPAVAADASPWATDAHSSLRLIAGASSLALPHAGIEVKLAPGWKTYWRYPGDSGVPPRFDFAGSENLKSATVTWPAPHRFVDEAGSSIGYKQSVIFPLRIVPQDASKPVRLRVKLDYAICEKLCIPATGEATLALTGEASTHAADLAEAEAQVPRPATLGDGAPLAIRVIRREAGARRDRIIVDVAAPSAPVDLFAEGPNADWALPVPDPIPGGSDGLQRFAFDLDGIPTDAKTVGAILTLTLVAGPSAIEVTAVLP
jgi:DsbC/DsbD-like thiol-disulfide interchange protein